MFNSLSPTLKYNNLEEPYIRLGTNIKESLDRGEEGKLVLPIKPSQNIGNEVQILSAC
jgi:hypothetical protein